MHMSIYFPVLPHLAAKMYLGMEQTAKPTRLNLTQLRRNVRKRKEKKSGRKVPRVGDCQVYPAPDATGELDPSLCSKQNKGPWSYAFEEHRKCSPLGKLPEVVSKILYCWYGTLTIGQSIAD